MATVRDAMTKDPRSLKGDSTAVEAARAMRDEDAVMIPIADGGRLAGVVTDRDLAIRVVAEGRDPNGVRIREIMSERLVTVDPGQDLGEAMRRMGEHQVRRLPVCEEDGRLVGVLAQADVARHGDGSRTGDTVERISR